MDSEGVIFVYKLKATENILQLLVSQGKPAGPHILCHVVRLNWGLVMTVVWAEAYHYTQKDYHKIQKQCQRIYCLWFRKVS